MSDETQVFTTGTFEEPTAAGHTRTVFRIDNPLQEKLNHTHLEQVAKESQLDRYAWIDAKMKTLLPSVIYKKMQDVPKQKEPKQGAALMAQVDEYMRQNDIKIVHPGGRSLFTYIYVKGKVAFEYELRLDTR